MVRTLLELPTIGMVFIMLEAADVTIFKFCCCGKYTNCCSLVTVQEKNSYKTQKIHKRDSRDQLHNKVQVSFNRTVLYLKRTR